MRQRKLEMLLEKVRRFERPFLKLEQYVTPPRLAAKLLYLAYMKGDIEGKKVVDLGCGTGILAIGSALLEGVTTGVDVDNQALDVARINAREFDVDITWVNSSVEEFQGDFDTIIMNPPFGAQRKGQDRPFLKRAFLLGSTVYMIQNAVSESFVRTFSAPNLITDLVRLKFPIAHTFKFHKKEITYIDVILFRMERAA
ncbi:MAG TPA: METTL5 family protein [Candidatus Acidoferrum sp.]|nr:METTL5 family protein [Candidatus Acidoferrum sp.]